MSEFLFRGFWNFSKRFSSFNSFSTTYKSSINRYRIFFKMIFIEVIATVCLVSSF